MDLKKIEEKFTKLYLNYQDSVFNRKKEYCEFLDSLSYCQINYLVKQGEITHEQTNNDLKTIGLRFRYYYEINPNLGFAEILVRMSTGTDESNIAKSAFRIFMNSKSHKSIIDEEKLNYFNFKFKYNLNGDIIGIGTFSTEKVNYVKFNTNKKRKN